MSSETLRISNSDAVSFIKTLPEKSIQCIICDPPFGLDEDTFDKHYARDASNVLEGYTTAPKDAKSYEVWACTWIREIPRVLRPDGTLYIVCAWNHVCDIELAVRSSGLTVLNHIIWKYNFGVYTQKKFVSSHYHILRCGLNDTPAFYTRAYYSETEKTVDGHNAQYMDLEDVWTIPKEFAQGKKKNVNKLPDALVRKMILYSSKPGDWVADFFLGNFTTAFVARREGRKFVGCEINEVAYAEHAALVEATPFAAGVTQEKPSTKPKNAGKRITEEEKTAILARYDQFHTDKTKKECLRLLQEEFERGHFSLLNILKAAGK
jgi:site-specific DNA-methyltransferase (adenine-specific)